MLQTEKRFQVGNMVREFRVLVEVIKSGLITGLSQLGAEAWVVVVG